MRVPNSRKRLSLFFMASRSNSELGFFLLVQIVSMAVINLRASCRCFGTSILGNLYRRTRLKMSGLFAQMGYSVLSSECPSPVDLEADRRLFFECRSDLAMDLGSKDC